MQAAKIENGQSLHSQREKDTGILVLTSDTQQEVVIKVGLPVEVCVGVVGLMTKKGQKCGKGRIGESITITDSLEDGEITIPTANEDFS